MANTKQVSKELEKKLTRAVIEALKDSAQLVEATAAQFCPVNTGNLRASITHEVDPLKLKASVFTNVFYSSMVEYGTEKMINSHGKHDPKNPVKTWEAKRKRGGWGSSQMPYMRPALDSQIENIKKIFASKINKIK